MKKANEKERGDVILLPSRPIKRFFDSNGSLKDALLPFIEGELKRRLVDLQKCSNSQYNENMHTAASQRNGVA